MNCQKCNFELPPNAQFCAGCGVHLFPPQITPPKKQWGMLKISFAGGIVFLVLIFFVTVLSLNYLPRLAKTTPLSGPDPTVSSVTSLIPAASPTPSPSIETRPISRKPKEKASPLPPSDSQGIRITSKRTKEAAVLKTGAIYSRDYITGARGGCYYINGNGNKTYVDRSLCGGTVSQSSRGGYITGPRGGCYYINRNGNKTYVDRSNCR